MYVVQVHATVSDLNDTDHPMFSGVVNHGFLSAAEVAALLKSVNIFVGLGFPFEGTGFCLYVSMFPPQESC